MLEHVPAWLGHLIAGVRAGEETLAIAKIGGGASGFRLSSPAFADGARLPERFTADGAGVSPPLLWDAPPEGSYALALLVEDADAPSASPLVHAIVWGLAPQSGQIPEGGIAPDAEGEADGRDVGRNSFLKEGWLPPDPPTGHGVHRYVFQLFALDGNTPDPGTNPGRSALIDAMTGHVLAAAILVGTYSRGEPADIGAVGALA